MVSSRRLKLQFLVWIMKASRLFLGLLIQVLPWLFLLGKHWTLLQNLLRSYLMYINFLFGLYV
ncbi:hypothetical protein BDQ12DRAFT_694270 [Crucibulum laeve]|uniref:Uncharacterized protein n=1 Tax=Crucibulum laeve TaxID=68775 RepID=A0A5C3LF35_9AGAR|nr:hypothetical protein BDQ12DRAFT_694270 [Crucibulum laeve]